MKIGSFKKVDEEDEDDGRERGFPFIINFIIYHFLTFYLNNKNNNNKLILTGSIWKN